MAGCTGSSTERGLMTEVMKVKCRLHAAHTSLLLILFLQIYSILDYLFIPFLAVCPLAHHNFMLLY